MDLIVHIDDKTLHRWARWLSLERICGSLTPEDGPQLQIVRALLDGTEEITVTLEDRNGQG